MPGPYNKQVFFESVSNVTATNSVEVGAYRQDGEDTYQYVYNAGGEDIAQSYGCTLSGVTGYSVTVSSLTNVDMFGHCKNATFTTATYGWILRRGFAAIEMGANNSAAAGALLCPSADGLYAHATQTTLPFGKIVGKAMEAIASGASGQAYLDFGGQ
jgi:hypothetical protein